MKKIIISILSSIISICTVNSQTTNFPYTVFGPNQVRIAVSPQFGACMNVLNTHSAGLEYPAGSGNFLSYSNTVIFGGRYNDGSLEIGAMKTAHEDYRFGNGPLSVVQGSGNGVVEDFGNAEIDSIEMLEWEQVYTVTKQDIEVFKQWFSCMQTINCNASLYYPNYQIPASILNWPAHGDVSQNQPYYLAPFYDYNNDGMYNPNDGDFPCIKGDYFAWMILNDKPYAGNNQNGMGVEIHISIYGYNKEPDNVVSKTIFVEYDVINRSSDTLNDFRFLEWQDFDIGSSFDDYIGTVPEENTVFGYNGDSFDDGQGGSIGYGTNIPVLSMKLLNKTALYGTYYMNLGVGAGPLTDLQYDRLLHGLWVTGDSLYFGGTGFPGTTGATSTTTNWVYPYTSTAPFNWTETNIDGQGATTYADDRRAHLVAGGEMFYPGTKLEYDYAFIVSQVDQGLVQDNLDQMLLDLPAIQQFYNDSIQGCTAALSGVLNTNNETELSFEVYPNPFEDNLEITTQSKEEYVYTIVDANGRLVMNGKAQGNTLLNLEFLEKGIYYLRLEGSDRRIQKILKL